MRPSLNVIWFVLLSCLSIPKLSAESLPGIGIVVFPVQSTIEEEGFQTFIVGKALAALGYEVHPMRKVDYDTALSSGDNYGFEMNSMLIVANRALAEQNPVAEKLFKVMMLPIQGISFQRMKMREGERSLQNIERHVDEWMARHQVLFDS